MICPASRSSCSAATLSPRSCSALLRPCRRHPTGRRPCRACRPIRFHPSFGLDVGMERSDCGEGEQRRSGNDSSQVSHGENLRGESYSKSLDTHQGFCECARRHSPVHVRGPNMSTNRCALAAFAVVVMMTAPGCGDSQATSVEQKPAASAPAQAAPLVPVLAKAHLADADAAAKKWHSDARLIQIAGRNVKDDVRFRGGNTAPIHRPRKRAWSSPSFAATSARRSRADRRVSRRRSATSSTAIRRSQSPAPTGVTKQSVSMVVMASPNRPGHAVWSVIEEGMRNPGDITLDIDVPPPAKC